jgi:hypothetical protein
MLNAPQPYPFLLAASYMAMGELDIPSHRISKAALVLSDWHLAPNLENGERWIIL